jgi:methyl-accepting chemotaxis protein
MNAGKKILVALLLCASVAFAQEPASSKHTKPKTKAQEKTAEQLQIEQTNQQLLDNMKQIQSQMNEMQKQLQQAQKDAASAKYEAAEASRKADGFQQVVSQNAEAVSTLQGAVTDLKGNATFFAQTIQDDQKQTKGCYRASRHFAL